MEKKFGGERKFVLRVLPWIVGAVALGAYLLTFNPWLSFFNSTAVARLSGWQWLPELSRPAYFLVTSPLKWLPRQHIPLALNLFTVVCAALAVGQLARTVVLLPYDRTQDQRLRERSPNSLLSLPLAWIPPVIAACALGLQLTFWDHATTGSPIMFNLLVFSFVVRTLLEYRNDSRESRLSWLAFIYGIGMANDTAMIGFFPLLIVALLWLRGVAFFNFRFLFRMIIFGLVGLSICLLLPFLASHSNVGDIDFWSSLKFAILSPEALLVGFPKKALIILAATTVLPAILLFIRWAYGFGDNSELGAALTTFIFHLVHAMFLLVCIWTVFDSPISPRERGLGYPFLPFYYLGSLSIGYFSGYFLLVFRRLPSERPSGLLKAVHAGATGSIIVLLVVVPLGLVAKNLPTIRTSNGPILREFAAALASGLPKSGMLLSDDNNRLVLLRSWLVHNGRENEFVPLSTSWLPYPAYHRYLQKTYPSIWPSTDDLQRKRMFSVIELTRLISKLALTNDFYYLHPSFGYYFENDYAEPHALVYKIKRYGSNELFPPPLSRELVRENEDFWSKVAPKELSRITAITRPPPVGEKPDLRARMCRTMRIVDEPNHLALAIGSYYSRSLDLWGVEMQKLNELKKAGEYFQLALDLKPDNVVAEINLECNTNLIAGESPKLKPTKFTEDLFGKYRSWDEVMNLNGPFDEPSFCFAASLQFARGRLYRQAIQNLDRVRLFAPDNVAVVVQLAQLSLVARYPDQALAFTQEIRSHPERYRPSSTNLIQLATVEGAAHLLRRETAAGTSILEGVANSETNNARLLDGIFKIYCTYGLFTNALGILDRQLAANAEDVDALINKGFVYSKLKEYDKAIPPLTEALNIQTNNPKAMFNRAIAYLYNSELAESKADYERLQEIYPRSYQIYFGLAEIALRNKDTNAAIQSFEAYVTNALPDAPETKMVQTRLNELKGIKDTKTEKAK